MVHSLSLLLSRENPQDLLSLFPENAALTFGEGSHEGILSQAAQLLPALFWRFSLLQIFHQAPRKIFPLIWFHRF